MFLLKVVLLVWYSNKKLSVWWLSWFLAKKLTLKIENAHFLTAPNQVVLQDIKKSFEEAHLDAKNVLNFTCHNMKFHICHHTVHVQRRVAVKGAIMVFQELKIELMFFIKTRWNVLK